MPCSASFFSSSGFCAVQLHRLGVAVGQERQAVGAEHLPLVLEVHQQHFAGLRLAALHGALDLRRLEQRRIGMHGDLELAAAGLVDVGGELVDVLGVEVGGRIGRGQVPLGLGRGAAGGDEAGSRKGERTNHRHGGHSCRKVDEGR
jgi:hypothetical protein